MNGAECRLSLDECSLVTSKAVHSLGNVVN